MNAPSLVSAPESLGATRLDLRHDPDLDLNLKRDWPPVLDLRSQIGAGRPSWPAACGAAEDAWTLRDASVTPLGVWHSGRLVQGSLTAWSAPEPELQARLLRRLERKTPVALAGVTAVIQKPGVHNYFHWSVEMLPRLALLAEGLRSGEIDRLLLQHEAWYPHVRQSLECWFPDLLPKVELLTDDVARCETLLMFCNPYEEMAAKVPTRLTRCSASWYRSLDRRLAGRSLPSPAGGLFVSRLDASRRRLRDEAGLQSRLPASGWRMLQASTLSVGQQVAAFHGARTVVGQHGAALTNAMYCRPGTRLIEISSGRYARRFHCYADIAEQRGMDYRLVLVDEVDAAADSSDPDQPDLLCGPQALDALVDLLLQSPA